MTVARRPTHRQGVGVGGTVLLHLPYFQTELLESVTAAASAGAGIARESGGPPPPLPPPPQPAYQLRSLIALHPTQLPTAPYTNWNESIGGGSGGGNATASAGPPAPLPVVSVYVGHSSTFLRREQEMRFVAAMVDTESLHPGFVYLFTIFGNTSSRFSIPYRPKYWLAYEAYAIELAEEAQRTSSGAKPRWALGGYQRIADWRSMQGVLAITTELNYDVLPPDVRLNITHAQVEEEEIWTMIQRSTDDSAAGGGGGNKTSADEGAAAAGDVEQQPPQSPKSDDDDNDDDDDNNDDDDVVQQVFTLQVDRGRATDQVRHFMSAHRERQQRLRTNSSASAAPPSMGDQSSPPQSGSDGDTTLPYSSSEELVERLFPPPYATTPWLDDPAAIGGSVGNGTAGDTDPDAAASAAAFELPAVIAYNRSSVSQQPAVGRPVLIYLSGENENISARNGSGDGEATSGDASVSTTPHHRSEQQQQQQQLRSGSLLSRATLACQLMVRIFEELVCIGIDIGGASNAAGAAQWLTAGGMTSVQRNLQALHALTYNNLTAGLIDPSRVVLLGYGSGGSAALDMLVSAQLLLPPQVQILGAAVLNPVRQMSSISIALSSREEDDVIRARGAAALGVAPDDVAACRLRRAALVVINSQLVVPKRVNGSNETDSSSGLGGSDSAAMAEAQQRPSQSFLRDIERFGLQMRLADVGWELKVIMMWRSGYCTRNGVTECFGVSACSNGCGGLRYSSSCKLEMHAASLCPLASTPYPYVSWRSSTPPRLNISIDN